MPSVQIVAPNGYCCRIDTRQTETLLAAWFDEVLSGCHWQLEDEELWPRINVHPMYQAVGAGQPDWLCDSRVICQLYEFRATNGKTGLAELLKLRQRLEQHLRSGLPGPPDWR